MRVVLTFILAFIYASSFGQLKIYKVDSANLPLKIKYEGHLINAVKWNDKLGLNYLITSETGNIQSKTINEEGYKDAALYAYHYIIKTDSLHLTWRLYDYNKECPLDLALYFLNNTFAITDLDKNAIAEVWMMYKNYCTGDVSPSPTKIIMYEGTKKYALRGESKVKFSATEFVGGNFVLDENFKKGKLVFREFAEKLWAKNKVEKWER